MDKKFTNMLLQFVGVLSLVALSIALGFRFSAYGDQLKINDFLGYTASFGGAILGAMTSLVILYITFKQTREIQEENRKQIYINNINEEIKDYSKMLEAVKKNSTLLEKIILEKNEDLNKFLSKLMELFELMNDYSLIAPMYLSEEIGLKAKNIDNLYANMILRGHDVLFFIQNNKDYEDAMLTFNNNLNDIIKNLIDLSRKLDKHIKDLYVKKYEKLHIKKEL